MPLFSTIDAQFVCVEEPKSTGYLISYGEMNTDDPIKLMTSIAMVVIAVAVVLHPCDDVS